MCATNTANFLMGTNVNVTFCIYVGLFRLFGPREQGQEYMSAIYPRLHGGCWAGLTCLALGCGGVGFACQILCGWAGLAWHMLGWLGAASTHGVEELTMVTSRQKASNHMDAKVCYQGTKKCRLHTLPTFVKNTTLLSYKASSPTFVQLCNTFRSPLASSLTLHHLS